MSTNSDKDSAGVKAEKRIHDQVPSEQYAEFMRGGWAPSDFEDLEPRSEERRVGKECRL